MTQQNQETVTKQKNSLRVEQGRRLVEHNRRKKEELKRLNKQITKQDGIEHKPRTDTNTYIYIRGLGVFGLAIGGYLLYSKFKKPERNLIDVPPPSNISNVNTNTEPKRDIFEMLQKFLSLNISWLKTVRKIEKKTCITEPSLAF